MTPAPALLPTAMTQVRALPLPSAAAAATLTTCLSESERELMTTYRHQRRRLEFVTGRLAVKRALLDKQRSAVRISSADPLPSSLVPIAQRMRVLPDDDGHPQLWLEDDTSPANVSIAHAAGWAAAACSRSPIGIDIVDMEASTAVPDNHLWLNGVPPEWRPRLRALLWGLRECLLKSGEIAAKTLWALGAVDAIPTCSANEIIARWPKGASLAPLEVQLENKTFAGAFTTLSQSAMLVTVLLPVPPSTDRMHLQ
jgi:phosphopantetheinyl transferase